MGIFRRDVSLNNKDIVIILVFVVLAAFLVAATHYGTKSLSAVRAYITAEGKWTKAQKKTVNLLLQFSIHQEPELYEKAHRNLQIHEGFRQARLALISGSSGYRKAVKGFEKAGTDPRDLELLIWLTTNFKGVDRMEEALSIWEQGDRQIARLDSLARQLHIAIEQDNLNSGYRNAFVGDITALDHKLTVLENSFSETMAEMARWVREVIFWTITGTGAVLLFLGYLITSRYFREVNNLNQRLSESEARFKKVLENSRDVIYELDFDTGNYEYMSPYVEEMLGYPAEKIIQEGKYFILNRIHPDDMQRLHEELKEMQGQEVEEHFAPKTEFRIKTNEGHYIWVSNHRSLVRDANGIPIRIVGSVRDISERKKHEDEMEKALQEKQILLKEIHHRVKNNLAVIYSLLEMQKQEPVESVPAMIEDTQARVQSIATIHEKLYQSETLSYIDIREYLEDFSELIMNSFNNPERSIELKKDLQSFHLDITKAAPLGLIFNELINNAFKHGFSESCEGSILINLTKNEHEATLSVADNGKGLPEDFNIEESASLGMTLIKTLSHQLQGKIEVNEGEWTTFHFTFPINKETTA